MNKNNFYFHTDMSKRFQVALNLTYICKHTFYYKIMAILEHSQQNVKYLLLLWDLMAFYCKLGGVLFYLVDIESSLLMITKV